MVVKGGAPPGKGGGRAGGNGIKRHAWMITPNQINK